MYKNDLFFVIGGGDKKGKKPQKNVYSTSETEEEYQGGYSQKYFYISIEFLICFEKGLKLQLMIFSPLPFISNPCYLLPA